MKTTALYDLDHTLIGCDSDYEWGQFLADSGEIDGAAYRARNQAFHDDYLQGRLDPHAYLDFALSALASVDPKKLVALRALFLNARIQPALRPCARQLIEKHQRLGFQQMIVTSTNAFVAGPVAQLLDIPTLVAPHPEYQDGRITGRLADSPCFGADKPRRVQEQATQDGIELGETWGYSDSFNDIPLLEFVDHPVAVNPDPTLRHHAQGQGWDIIRLDESYSGE